MRLWMLWLILLWVTPVMAAEWLMWSPVTMWTDGRVMTPSEQQTVQYRVWVGESPTTLEPVMPAVVASPLRLSAMPQVKPGRYIGMTAVLGGEPGVMSSIVRYAPPGDVLGLTFVTVQATTSLTWRPVLRYQDGQRLTDADQQHVRYRMFVGPNRGHVFSVLEDMREPPVVLNTVPDVQPGYFIAMMAYLPGREGRLSRAERWQVRRDAGAPRAVNKDDVELEPDPCDDSR